MENAEKWVFKERRHNGEFEGRGRSCGMCLVWLEKKRAGESTTSRFEALNIPQLIVATARATTLPHTAGV